jgi:hypothetical protein
VPIFIGRGAPRLVISLAHRVVSLQSNGSSAIGGGLSQADRAGVLMNSRNGHLTGLVIDAYLSRKIQKCGVASHANALLPLSAPASFDSGRGRDWP